MYGLIVKNLSGGVFHPLLLRLIQKLENIVPKWNFNTPVTFDIVCDICGENSKITCDADDVQSWKDGMLIQDCLDYLHSEQRQLLISGTCGDCSKNFSQNN